MTAPAFKRAVLHRIGFVSAAPDYVIEDFVTAVNQSFQQLQTDLPQEARLHFTRDTVEINLEEGENVYVLDDDVQAVVSPARLATGDRALHPVRSQYEITHFNSLHGARTTTVRPLVYFVRTRNKAASPEAAKIEIWVAPTPADPETMVVEVERDWPSLEADDFCIEEAADLPIPHQYVESILVPMTAYNLTRSLWFNDKAMIPELEKDYLAALRRAGATDPQLVEVANATVPRGAAPAGKA